MFKLLGNKRLFILMLALIFFIAVMGITKGGREKPTWAEHFVADTVTWLQGAVSRLSAFLAALAADIRSLRTVYEENKALKRTLAYYARDVARLNALERENERLKEALAFTERQKSLDDYVYRIAHVISMSPDVLNNTMRIDLGEVDGIKVNMAVVTPDGLIGRVVRVTSFTSTVELILNLAEDNSDTKAIAATVRGKESLSFGIVQSYDREQNLLTMTKIKQDDPLAEGDVVITSGTGGVYPPGIVIGTVVSREAGGLGTITHAARIRPAADFDPLRLREVFVVEVPER